MKSLASPQSPLLLQRLQWVLDPIGYLEKTHEQYPDIFIGRGIGFGEEVVITSHPQAIEQILTNDRKQFTAPGNLNQILEPLVGELSVILIDGDRHRKRRQLVMPSFHGDRMRSYGELIISITKRVIDQLPNGSPFVARTVMQAISLDVIIQAVFGLFQGERYEKLKFILAQMMEQFNSPVSSTFLFFKALQTDLGAWSPWGNFVRQRQAINDLIYLEIAERRENLDPSRTDILSLLLMARDQQGNPLSDQELRDELMTLLVAGHETTATAMSWALYWIHWLPSVKARLLAELDAIKPSAEPMDIFRLPYLTAVCQETLRIHPVAMLTFPRVAQETVEILGHKLESGTIIMGCMYLTHQREDIYPNHTQFDPERFLNRQFSPYEFCPFGGGVRRCMGEALAQFELRLVIATIMSHYELALADTQPEKPRRRGVTLAPTRGVKLLKKGLRSAKSEIKPQIVLR